MSGILHTVKRESFSTTQEESVVIETTVAEVPPAAKSAEEKIAELEAKIEALLANNG
jgi:hypothetical protein